ncbi:putative membrane protein [Corynebacterium simulans]|mgnify:FL=1|uniref:hypothetical protein n=1 Tax=Corynebacterium simulans TaxID=146827 RepID=UPI000786756F|nr:hypothetical protein [Corynebacterium simulans]AMO90102.1 putative membrane protein [Corynebacterium simulans]
MRNFRTAAVALATATTVAFGGVSAASAAELEDGGKPYGSSNWSTSAKDGIEAGKKVSENDNKEQSLSSKWAGETDGTKPAQGQKLLGSSVDDETNALWAKLWRDGTYAALAASVIGGLIAAYNQAVYTGILPQHILDPIFRR